MKRDAQLMVDPATEDHEMDVELTGEVTEENAIAEPKQIEYRIWKKNAPYLYDYLSTNSLLWPSLTVQFFPDLVTADSTTDEVVLQRLLYGTFTLGKFTDSLSIVQVPFFKNLNKNITIKKLDYNQEKQEFELTTSSSRKLKLLQKINHKGDVNTLKYMPQNPNIIASANNYGDLFIYERTKHSSLLRLDDEISKVQISLKSSRSNNENDVFALDWNLQTSGIVASGDVNGNLNVYDIKKYNLKDLILNEDSYISNNSVGINDLQWFPNHDSLLSFVDESGQLKVYDTRSNSIVNEFKVSENGVNTLSINRENPTCIATGDSVGLINIIDIRNCESFKKINQHLDSITRIKWNRKHQNILASSSSDSTVKLFNISESNENEGLIFVHKGHMLGVNDIDWSYHDDWLISSVGDDNSLHVWKPYHDIIKDF